MTNISNILSHLKVVELASVLAGPDVGMFFAELGAKVIKIENKKTNGDVTRSWKLPSEDSNTYVSAYFSSINYNKEYHFVDFTKSEELKEVLHHIATADIVIANFKKGDDIKFGLDYKTLKKTNTTLIYGSITGYGNDSYRTAYDVVLQAETGFMSMNGTLDSGPIKMPVALIDVLAAHQLKEGLLIALLEKEKHSKGAFVEVSLYDSAVSSLKNQASNWLMNGHIAQPIGSLHPNIAPYGEVFLTKDEKYIVLAIGNDKHFSLLLKLLDAEILLKETKYQNNSYRVANRKNLFKDLKPMFLLKTRAEFMSQFIENGIPAGAIYTIDEVFENPAAKALILEEQIDFIETKRVKTAVFKITRS